MGLVGRIPRRELLLVAAALAIGLALRLTYVLATSGNPFSGDESEYDLQGKFIAAGKWFWSTTPYGIPHESMWKAPGYPAFVGVLYKLLGEHSDRVLVFQAFVSLITVGLTWVLGRRLFGPAVGVAAAAVVAIHPFAWLIDSRLFPEVLVTPLTMGVVLIALAARPTARAAALAGFLTGLSLLVRPSALYLLPMLAAAWVLAAGVRPGLRLTLVTAAVAVLTVAPWTYRNYRVSDSFVAISIQDAAAFGTFNDDAANDPVLPYAWRANSRRDAHLFDRRNPLPDAELRRRASKAARDYIREHPSSVVKAFYWNGLTRLWDVRRPSHVLREAEVQGRSRNASKVGLAIYWILLPLSLAGLWLARGRRRIVIPLVVLAVSASVVFTTIGGTRYRAPFEPVIAVLACSAAAALLERRRGAAREPA